MLDLLLAHDSWLISPDALDHLASRAEAYGRGLIKEQSTPQIPLTEVRDGIAEIAIHGTMARRPNDLTRWLTEATDTEQVLEAVRLAAADDSIESILLDIDSPGGSVAGVPELAEAVAEASKKKPIYAWTGGRMASAAYWVASQADGISPLRLRGLGRSASSFHSSIARRRWKRTDLRWRFSRAANTKLLGCPEFP